MQPFPHIHTHRHTHKCSITHHSGTHTLTQGDKRTQRSPLEMCPAPGGGLLCRALLSAIRRSICSFCCVILVRALCSTLRDWACFFSSSAVSACRRVFSACSAVLSACCFCKLSWCWASSCKHTTRSVIRTWKTFSHLPMGTVQAWLCSSNWPSKHFRCCIIRA